MQCGPYVIFVAKGYTKHGEVRECQLSIKHTHTDNHAHCSITAAPRMDVNNRRSDHFRYYTLQLSYPDFVMRYPLNSKGIN